MTWVFLLLAWRRQQDSRSAVSAQPQSSSGGLLPVSQSSSYKLELQEKPVLLLSWRARYQLENKELRREAEMWWRIILMFWYNSMLVQLYQLVTVEWHWAQGCHMTVTCYSYSILYTHLQSRLTSAPAYRRNVDIWQKIRISLPVTALCVCTAWLQSADLHIYIAPHCHCILSQLSHNENMLSNKPPVCWSHNILPWWEEGSELSHWVVSTAASPHHGRLAR